MNWRKEMNDKVIKFLEQKSWSLPYSEVDLLDAIELGRQLIIDEIILNMKGQNVNGILQTVLMEDTINEILKKD